MFPRHDSTTTVPSDSNAYTGDQQSINTHRRFPSTVSYAPSRFSVNRTTALELHDLIYGTGDVTLSIHNRPGAASAVLARLYEPDAVYSNPLVTASSGNIIKDIHSLMHTFTDFSLPTPWSWVSSFFGRGKPEKMLSVAKVWSEIGEVLESDVYDGHRRITIEHTVYLLFLPEIFKPEIATRDLVPGSTSTFSINDPYSSGSMTPGGYPSGPTAHRPSVGQIARMVTTLARQMSLPVHTRLSFNDSGLITHHQDIWDVKDICSLVPGVSVAQWISSRLVARSLAGGFEMYAWLSGRPPTDPAYNEEEEKQKRYIRAVELGEHNTGAYSPSEHYRSRANSSNALGVTSSEDRGSHRTPGRPTFAVATDYGSRDSLSSAF